MKKWNKVLLAMGTMGSIVAPVAATIACSGAGATKDVGATVWKADDAFMSVVKAGFQKASEETGQTYSWADGEGDQTKMNDKIDALINQGVKVLAINLVDIKAAQTIINKAKKAGLPLIFYNKEASETAMASYDKVWYVGTRSRQSGEMQVQDIAKALFKGVLKDRNNNGIIEYFIINGEANHPDAAARTEAVRVDLPTMLAKAEFQTDPATLSKADNKYAFFKKNHVVATRADAKWIVDKDTHRLYVVKGAIADDLSGIYKDEDYKAGDPENTEYNATDWSAAKGKEVAAPKITAMGDRLDFIAANNDGTALGAVAAIKEKSFVALSSKDKVAAYIVAGDKNYLPVFGVDNTGDAVKSMAAGWLSGTVLNDGVNQGYIAMIMSINSYKEGTSNDQLLKGLDATKYNFTNDLAKASKAIRVDYKPEFNPLFE